MESTVSKKKNANIELLRLISMYMVVMLHALGKGNLLVNLSANPGVNAAIAWILEALSISAVNIFMLISGYFLIDSTFKLRRLLELVAQTIFYSLGAFLVCLLCGVETGMEINVYNLLHCVFPVHMNLYWFITSYVVIYMLLPVIAAGVKNISQKHFGTMLIILITYECLFKSLLPVRLEEDEYGYNFLWFLIVFLVGAYLKLYGFKHLKTSGKGAGLYFAASALIFIENTVLNVVITKTGHLSEISGISFEYNHLFVLAASVGIFAAFINKKPIGEKPSKIITALSPMALGVYLCHENLSFRYNWPKWLGISDSLGNSVPAFVGKLLLATLIVFAAGLAIDFVRIKLFGLFCKKKSM